MPRLAAKMSFWLKPTYVPADVGPPVPWIRRSWVRIWKPRRSESDEPTQLTHPWVESAAPISQ
ncbi:hypothetical protein D3C83_326180 [compost metagenome]